MTIIQIINQLQQQGHNVKYFKRKDGGYRITNVDGVSFTGSQGNDFARQLTGQQLSQARRTQLTKNRQIQKPHTFGIPKGKTKTPLPKDIQNTIRRIQKKQRELSVPERVTTKNIRYSLQHEGEQLTRQHLERVERYYSGYTYAESIQALIMRLESINDKIHSTELMRVIRRFREIMNYDNGAKFKEVWLQDILAYLYEWEHAQINESNFISICDYYLNQYRMKKK